MAFYDIAAAQPRISPVQEMLQGRAQGDAHKINQANLRAAEIREPYIKTLIEQDVRKGEQDIAREDVEAKYRDKGLDQQQRAAEHAIDLAGEQLKKQQRVRQFAEAASSGEYTDDELQKKFPIQYGEFRTKELTTISSEIGLMEEKLAMINSGGTPEEKAVKFAEAVSELPEEVRGKVPPVDAENVESVLAGMEQAIGQRSNNAFSQLAQDYKRYKAQGEDELAALMLKQMNALATRYSLSGTEAERRAQLLFGWSETPLAAAERYDRVAKQIKTETNTLLKEGLSGKSRTDDIFGSISLYDLINENPEEYRAMVQDITLHAVASIGDEDMAFYLDAQRRINEMTGVRETSYQQPTAFDSQHIEAAWVELPENIQQAMKAAGGTEQDWALATPDQREDILEALAGQ